jgi:hypothetical protein
MARYKGKDGAIEAGGTEIGEVESFDYTVNINELDANVIGSDSTGLETGQKSLSGTISVLSDPTDAGQITLTVGSEVALTLFPQGETTGLTELSCPTAVITEKGVTVSAGDLVKTTYNFRNNGDFTDGTVA